MADLSPTARTTVALVKEIIQTSLADPIIHSFINSAHYTVQAQLVDTSAGLSASQLANIEMWLAAHFMAVSRERQVESETVGDEWQARYQGKTDMGLNSTLYGQTALSLDTSGKLATLGKQKAHFKVFS